VFITRPRQKDETEKEYALIHHPSGLYNKLHIPFRRVLGVAQMGTRKEEGIIKRGLVTHPYFRVTN
jgi:hypothetical protein